MKRIYDNQSLRDLSEVYRLGSLYSTNERTKHTKPNPLTAARIRDKNRLLALGDSDKNMAGTLGQQ